MLKTSMLGLGSAAVLFVAWRLLTVVFVVGVVALKILFFYVIPIALVIWLVRKVLVSERAGA
jgi:hypothetical protein